MYSPSRTLRSIYFGGGTPSLSENIVPTVLHEIIAQKFAICPDTEVTLEANPTSTPDATTLKLQGVTRLSLGVQSLTDNSLLKRFGREHTCEQARYLLDNALASPCLRHGFSFDIMFGASDVRSIEKDLTLAIPYAKSGGHLSLYELTIERGTLLYKEVMTGDARLPGQDLKADEYELASNLMESNGFDHYEISSFAKPGNYSRHNMAFWQGGDLIGIGPGAHGRVHCQSGIRRTMRIREPKRWEEQVLKIGHGMAKTIELTSDDVATELIALGLRTSTGVLNTRFESLTGKCVLQYLDLTRLTELQAAGMVQYSREPVIASGLPEEWQSYLASGALRATRLGRQLLDNWLPSLLR